MCMKKNTYTHTKLLSRFQDRSYGRRRHKEENLKKNLINYNVIICIHLYNIIYILVICKCFQHSIRLKIVISITVYIMRYHFSSVKNTMFVPRKVIMFSVHGALTLCIHIYTVRDTFQSSQQC